MSWTNSGFVVCAHSSGAARRQFHLCRQKWIFAIQSLRAQQLPWRLRLAGAAWVNWGAERNWGRKRGCFSLFLPPGNCPQCAWSPSSVTEVALQVVQESGPREVGQSLPGPVLVSQAGDVTPVLTPFLAGELCACKWWGAGKPGPENQAGRERFCLSLPWHGCS